MISPAEPRSGAATRGFTLIEMLVVIMIIMILAGLLLTGWQALQRTFKKTKTMTILQVVEQGLAHLQSETGAAPPPAEHPFAGSKAPRLTFVGDRGAGWGALQPNGEALYGVTANRLPTMARGWLIQDDDLFAEPDIPGMYGLERRTMGVLGSPVGSITRYLDLQRSGLSADVLPPPYAPFDPIISERGGNFGAGFTYETADPPHYQDMRLGNPLYDRELCLVEGIKTLPGARLSNSYFGVRQTWHRVITQPRDNREVFTWLLPSNLQEELRELGALRSPPDDTRLLLSGPSTPAGKIGQAVESSEAIYGSGSGTILGAEAVGYEDVEAVADNPRVWSDDGGESVWEPGRIRVSDSGELDGTGQWRSYMLRGPAIYDAWGREILYARTDAGGFVLLSAGGDGCFVLEPGMVDANGASIFATDVSAGYDGTPVAPDRNATDDNVSLGR